MKLKHIISESRRDQTIPVEVEYEVETEDSNGDYETIDIIVELDVHVTPDQHNTGDSPTGYEAVIKTAYRKDDDKPFDYRKLDKKAISWIKDKAIENSQR